MKKYGVEVSAPAETAERFFDYYTARGWMIGDRPVADWQALFRSWLSREKPSLDFRITLVERVKVCEQHDGHTGTAGGQGKPRGPGGLSGEDGRLYCGKCHTPKQWRSPGAPISPVPANAPERFASRKKRNSAGKTALTVPVTARRFPPCMTGRSGGKTFDRHDGTNAQALKAALTYVKHWAEAKRGAAACCSGGDTGTGKSFLSCCIATP